MCYLTKTQQGLKERRLAELTGKMVKKTENNKILFSPYVVSCPSNSGKKERANISEDLSMKPRLT